MRRVITPEPRRYVLSLADGHEIELLENGIRCERKLAPIETLASIVVGADDLEQFREGTRQPELREQFSHLFDDDDLRIAVNQPSYHFGEWMSAVWFWEQHRISSISEHYKHHDHKRKRVARFISHVMPLIDQESGEPPDLFLYAGKAWAFCEVKRLDIGNKLSSEQERRFEALARATGRPVLVVPVMVQ